MMKHAILHVVAPGQIGGVERVVQALTAGLAGRGHAVHVAAVLDSDQAGEAFVAPLEAAGVVVERLVHPGRQYVAERRGLREVTRRVEPVLVHTHGYRADVLGGSAARSLGVPVVATVHGFTGGGWKNRFYERLQRRAFRKCDAVVVVSRPLVDHLATGGVRRERIHLIPNAWGGVARPLAREEARRELGIEDDAFHLGWVGRVTAEKGPDVMVDALPLLADLAPVVSFVGDGRRRLPLQARAASLGVADRIRWHGIVPDASRFFAAFDAFVLSSRTEGTPIVLFEAMAASVPIVATAVGGVPDVVSKDEALLVPPEDPAALAAGIRAVRTDVGSCRARAAAARARLWRQFALEPWLVRHENLYRQVAGLPLVREIA